MQILIIQTAFIGDVILATSLLEKLSGFYPQASVDFLVRKGNEALLQNHPKVRAVHCWNKDSGKLRNLARMSALIRKQRYDLIINLHRHLSGGLLTVLSGARETRGFRKNPLSFLFDKTFAHPIGDGTHEVERNHKLIADLTDDEAGVPKLYPSQEDIEKVADLKSKPYLTIAPASVWFTKQFPAEKWIAFLRQTNFDGNIYLIGSPEDAQLCDHIVRSSASKQAKNLCGQLSLLEAAALMKDARLNYVNDSAPLHLASAVNAPVCAVFCSTVPAFGFGPLSDRHYIIQIDEALYCRPCGVHGYKRCPQKHFKCAEEIEISRLLQVLDRISGN